MEWLEVSIRVNHEAAEAVAEVLSRYAPEGVALELDPDAANDAPVTVKAYLAVDDEIAMRRRKVEEGLAHLSHIWPVIPPPTFATIPDQDWTARWKAQIKVLHLGRHVVIRPSWRTYVPKKDEIVLEMDPGIAFGTGLHPTTQLCIGAVEALARPDSTLLDLGTGTGILAMVAARLGARHILAVDIDQNAVVAARRNVLANGLEERITVRAGSLSDVDGAYDLVMANILAPVIIEMAAAGLAERVRPGGIVVASGILGEQVDDVVVALEAHGLRVTERHLQGEWAALYATPV